MAYQAPLNGGRINASIGGNSTSAGGGYQLVSTGTVHLMGGNNVTLSQNANSISINAGGGGTMSMYALGNTTQNSSATMDVRSVSLNGLGGLTAGYSNGSVQLSAPVVSSLSATGAVSISNNGGTISIGAPAFSGGMSNLGNTSGSTGTVTNGLYLAGGNNVTLSQSTNGVSAATITISAAAQTNQTANFYVSSNSTQLSSTAGIDLRSLSFQGAGNVSIGVSQGKVLVSGGGGGGAALSAGTQSVSTGTVNFANSNGITFGMSGSNQITASHNGITSQSAQTIGGYATGNTTGQSSSSTFDARSMSMSGVGAISLGYSGSMLQVSAPAQSSLSQTGALSISRNGSTISIGVPAVSMGMSTIGNTSGTTGTVSNQLIFAGGNNVTLSQSTGAGGNTLTISAANQTNQNMSLYALGNTTQNSSTLLNASNMSFNGLGAATMGYSNGSIQVSVPTQTNQTLGISATSNTFSSSNGTVDARSLYLRGVGAASVGISNGSILISAPNAAAGNVTFSAGGNSAGLASIVFSNSNGVSFGLNGSTITASAAGGGGGIALANSQTTYTSGTANLNVAGGAMTIASTTGQSFNFSVPATSSLSVTGALSLSTNGSTVSIGAPASSSLVGISPISLSTNGSTISISANSTTFNSTVLGRGNNAWVSNSTSLGQNTLYIFPEVVQQYVSGSVVKIPVLVTNSSSGFAAHTRGHTVNFGVYSRHATNSTILTQMYSTSYTAAVSASSNASWAISLITGLGNSTSYNSVTASSAGLNLSASVHGPRELLIAFATQLSPGEYWFGIQNSSSSAGAAGNLFQLSYPVMSATAITGNAFGMSTNTASRGIYQNMGQGVYSVTTGALPAGISMTQINQSAINPLLYFMNATA